MNAALLGIVVAYAALAVLLLMLCLYTKWLVWVKASAIVLVSAFYYVSYMSLEGFLGWPAHAALPQEFVLLAGKVEEPNESLDREGSVYLWTLPLDDGNTDGTPRAYELPYDKSLHNQISEATKKLRRGIAQVGKRENLPIKNPATGQAWFEQYIQQITIYDLPDPELPDK